MAVLKTNKQCEYLKVSELKAIATGKNANQKKQSHQVNLQFREVHKQNESIT